MTGESNEQLATEADDEFELVKKLQNGEEVGNRYDPKYRRNRFLQPLVEAICRLPELNSSEERSHDIAQKLMVAARLADLRVLSDTQTKDALLIPLRELQWRMEIVDDEFQKKLLELGEENSDRMAEDAARLWTAELSEGQKNQRHQQAQSPAQRKPLVVPARQKRPHQIRKLSWQHVVATALVDTLEKELNRSARFSRDAGAVTGPDIRVLVFAGAAFLSRLEASHLLSLKTGEHSRWKLKREWLTEAAFAEIIRVRRSGLKADGFVRSSPAES